MTMLASWITFDSHGPGSAYIVGDSRFSWNHNIHYDHGKKTFACKTYPEIFGYAGDVTFPSVVLAQIVEMIDSSVLFTPDLSCNGKNQIIFDKICQELKLYHINRGQTFQFLHITRDTVVASPAYPKFHAYTLSYNDLHQEERTTLKIPDKSGLLCVLGSGAPEFRQNYCRYQNGLIPDTSRNVFQCFIDTLLHVTDSSCGGAPQLVGLYRKPKSCGMYFGIIYNKTRFFAGTEVPDHSDYSKIIWHNDLFENCDGNTMLKFPDAQPQPDSLRRN